MADNVDISTGLGGTATISADEASSGLLQRVKLSYSADGSDTHIPAGAGGLLVDLGANNDVTVTSGSVAVSGGTVTVGGTANVAITGGTAVFSGSMAAGTAVIGKVGLSADGTAVVDILSLTSGTALAVGLYDTTGTQVSFTAPAVLSGTATNGTAQYASGDTMGTVIAFANATRGSGYTGHIVSAVAYVAGDVAAQNLRFWVFDSAPVPSADNAALAISTSDILKTKGVINFQDWYDAGTAHVSVGRLTPMGHPLAIQTVGSGTAYGLFESRGTGTYATAVVSIDLQVIKD